MVSNTHSSLLTSCLCIQAHWDTVWLPRWSKAIKESPDNLHRKLWEWCFIPQALYERGFLQPGKKGLGFAVGKEPLTDLFASYGCEILATDLDSTHLSKDRWAKTNQHADTREELNERGLCSFAQFRKLVAFRSVDMNHIPDDLIRGYDFLWSCCAVEHLGSIQRGLNFMYNAMDCLKPGGIAVHTTDFNVSSDDETLDTYHDVLFRKQDIQWLERILARHGHRMAAPDFDPGSGEADQFISYPPYIYDRMHLKLQIGALPGGKFESYTGTSMGIIIQKRPAYRDLIERVRALLYRTCSHFRSS